MTLYSFNGARPTPLPNRIKLSNGFTRTDKSTFTPEEIADAGWVLVDNPPVVEYPNKLEWNGETLSWYSREPNTSEIAMRWQEIRNMCLTLLENTDYKVLKSYEAGVPVEQTFIDYRQALRDIYNNVNNIDPWNVSWPAYPDEL